MGDIEANNEKLEGLKRRHDAAIIDYKTYYVNYNMIPNDQDEQHLADTITKLETINAELFVASNEIQSELNSNNIIISQLSTDIETLKSTNNILKQRKREFVGKNSAAFIMNYDSFESYKYQYIINWGMVVGIILLSRFVYKSFNNPVG